MSSGICLVGMILFAVTGITLNHAGQIEAKASTTSREATLPPALLKDLQMPADGRQPLPVSVRSWLQSELNIVAPDRGVEWSAREVYVGLPRPGGDAWVSIERATGATTYESTSRGWIAYLNDLHKGRNTGASWSWFIDIFAGAALVFCATGLLLLQLHATRRPATWPIVGLGFVLPVLLLVLFVHR